MTEDLCNAIRGGTLPFSLFRTCELTLVLLVCDVYRPHGTFTFYQMASYQGLALNNRQLKIGGKNTGPLLASLVLAVHVEERICGNIENFETFTEDRVKGDFRELGEIELVNFLREKCVFVFSFVSWADRRQELRICKLYQDFQRYQGYGWDKTDIPPGSPLGSCFIPLHTHTTPTSPPSLGRHHLAKGFKTKRKRSCFSWGGNKHAHLGLLKTF